MHNHACKTGSQNQYQGTNLTTNNTPGEFALIICRCTLDLFVHFYCFSEICIGLSLFTENSCLSAIKMCYCKACMWKKWFAVMLRLWCFSEVLVSYCSCDSANISQLKFSFWVNACAPVPKFAITPVVYVKSDKLNHSSAVSSAGKIYNSTRNCVVWMNLPW